jgi:hypothetical protein
VVLAPLIGWHPGQLPGWPAPLSDNVHNETHSSLLSSIVDFIARIELMPFVRRSAHQMPRVKFVVYTSTTEFLLSQDVFSSRYSKLLDESLSPVMFMQMLCTAVLLAFIGVLLSVSVTTRLSLKLISFYLSQIHPLSTRRSLWQLPVSGQECYMYRNLLFSPFVLHAAPISLFLFNHPNRLHILSNSSFACHVSILRYIVSVTDKAPLN